MGVEFHGNGPLDKCLIDLSLWIVARDVSRGFAPIVREPKGLPQGPFGPPPAVLRTLDPNPWVHESETINLQNINITLTVALVLVSALPLYSSIIFLISSSEWLCCTNSV
jgi:hypothetical protein